MQKLHSLWNVPLFQIANCMPDSNYVDIDVEVETEELPSDDDIVAMVQKEGEDNDDGGADSPIPILMQAIHAGKVLQQYCDSRTDREDSIVV